MTIERTIRLFRNGRNQALRIPREFELPGAEAIMPKEGDRLVIEPAPRKSLIEILASLKPMDDDFGEIKELPVEPVDFS